MPFLGPRQAGTFSCPEACPVIDLKQKRRLNHWPVFGLHELDPGLTRDKGPRKLGLCYKGTQTGPCDGAWRGLFTLALHACRAEPGRPTFKVSQKQGTSTMFVFMVAL